jgi:hypothetical protein
MMDKKKLISSAKSKSAVISPLKYEYTPDKATLLLGINIEGIELR